MKRVFLLFIALMLLLSVSICYADTQITVSGTGEVYVSADTAIVTVGVSMQDSDVKQAQEKVNQLIASIRQSLIDYGIVAENINTDYINIYPVYDYTQGYEIVAAYSVSSTLSVKTNDMDSVGTIIDRAFAAGANMLTGITFTASDTTQEQNNALNAAIQNARERAEIIAQSMGMSLIEPVSITDNYVSQYDSGVNNFSEKIAEDIGNTETVVQAAKICVTAGVTIVFLAK